MSEEDLPGAGPPPNPLAGRQRRLVITLRVATVVAFTFGVAALVLPGEAGRVVAAAMVVVLVVTPLARVAWLVLRWGLRRDWRFAGAGVALLTVVALGLLTH